MTAYDRDVLTSSPAIRLASLILPRFTPIYLQYFMSEWNRPCLKVTVVFPLPALSPSQPRGTSVWCSSSYSFLHPVFCRDPRLFPLNVLWRPVRVIASHRWPVKLLAWRLSSVLRNYLTSFVFCFVLTSRCVDSHARILLDCHCGSAIRLVLRWRMATAT